MMQKKDKKKKLRKGAVVSYFEILIERATDNQKLIVNLYRGNDFAID